MHALGAACLLIGAGAANAATGPGGATHSSAQTANTPQTNSMSGNGLTGNGMSGNGMTGNSSPAPKPQSPVAKAIAGQLQNLNAANANGQSANGQNATGQNANSQNTQNPNSRVAAIKAFYHSRGDRPAWFNAQGQASPAASALIHYIHGVSGQGLSPAAYLQGPLASGLPKPSGNNPQQLATADLAMSRAFVALAYDLHHGVVNDPSVRAQWQKPNAQANFQQALAHASSGNPAKVLNSLAPQQPQYAALVKALGHYEQIAGNGGWPTIGKGKVLKKGMTDPRIATLWHRLQVTGDAPANTAAPSSYNPQIMNALRHFQKRNGLKSDGVLGPNTRTALNVSAAQRVDDIKINLERWRWMPSSLGNRYIAVNVPAYRLRAVDANGRTLSMKVIVGSSYHGKNTPMFSDNMQYLIFRPYWNVPPNIANKALVPHARKNLQWLSDHHYQIVKSFNANAKPLAINAQNVAKVANGQLLMRQTGGSYNALGLVKFIFPNNHAVYLHSTSDKTLFKRHTRDLSHGCVRVARPVALAQFVLSDQADWNKSRIENAMHSGGRKKVTLAHPIPVYMQYWTAFVGPNGTMNFRKDLYGRNKTLENSLANDPQITL